MSAKKFSQNEIDIGKKIALALVQKFERREYPFDKNLPEEEYIPKDISQKEQALFITLTMSIDYRKETESKNGKKGLWEASANMWKNNKELFIPSEIEKMGFDKFRDKFYSAMGPIVKFPDDAIWYIISKTLLEYDSNPIEIFKRNRDDAKKVEEMLINNQKKFPWLRGSKIRRVWIRMMSDIPISGIIRLPLNRLNEIQIPVDSHIRKATGKITGKDMKDEEIREFWDEVCKQLENKNIFPLKIDPPLWFIDKKLGKYTIEDMEKELGLK